MKKVILGIVMVVIMSFGLIGCEVDEARQVRNQQMEDKSIQAMNVMKQTPVPEFKRSLERENIVKRLKVTNDPNTLQWIYPMSAGRVVGRFPVLGKVTGGSKRLTPETYYDGGGSKRLTPETYYDGGGSEILPDETGAYGSSDAYIFWFDPAGRYHQHRGDYFLSPVPYKIDLNYGTISVEIDQTEKKG